jgi:hypothetical protein
MSTKTQTSAQSQQAADQALIDGFTKHQGALPSSLTVAGAPVLLTTILSTLQSRVASRATVPPAKASYQAVVQANHDELTKSQPLASGVRQAIALMFAGQVQVLADYGLKPRKVPAPRTPAQKAASAAKAAATRAARHTMGPVQKAKITGASPQGTAAPVATPSPAAPPVTAPATAATKS